MKKHIEITIIGLVMLFSGVTTAQKYSGGTGTQADPYQIGTADDWQELTGTSADWGSHFIVTNNIDFEGAEIARVGSLATGFSGVLDGKGYSLSNFVIDQPSSDYIGIFGYIEDSGQLNNLGVEVFSITGRHYVGGLCGLNHGKIANSYAIGELEGDWRVGGLCGFNEGMISQCYFTGTVVGSGTHIGGLCGNNDNGTITNSYAGGSVQGNERVGGLSGNNSGGTITQSYATATVTGNSSVGGLCGADYGGTINESYATGNVSGSVNIGGLVGIQGLPGGKIINCYASGDVNGGDNVGGLVGRNYQAKVIHCYSKGKPAGDNYVGGLCGSRVTGGNYEDTGNFWDKDKSQTETSAMGTGKTTSQMKNQATFIDAGWDFIDIWWMPEQDYPKLLRNKLYSGGDGTPDKPYIIAEPPDWFQLIDRSDDWDKYFILANDIDFEGAELTPVGTSMDMPFVGDFDGQGYVIRNALIDLPGEDNVGLFGCLRKFIGSSGEIRNLQLSNITVVGVDDVGALVGRKFGLYTSLDNCHARNVTVSGNWRVGGLVGHNYRGSITRSSATGEVSGSLNVGGLLGNNLGTYYGFIENCHASCSVTGYKYTGGLIGTNSDGKIINCYSAGMITATSETNIGGLVGRVLGDYSEDTGNFWDIEASKIGESAAGTGKTTAEMMTQSTFTDAGWDFINMWGIGQGHTYPYHRTTPIADLDGDGSVDMMDFAIFAEQWLVDNE